VAAARFALDRMSVSPLAELVRVLVELEWMRPARAWMDLEDDRRDGFPMDELTPRAGRQRPTRAPRCRRHRAVPRVRQGPGQDRRASLLERFAPAHVHAAAPARLRPRGNRPRNARCSRCRSASLPTSAPSGRPPPAGPRKRDADERCSARSASTRNATGAGRRHRTGPPRGHRPG